MGLGWFAGCGSSVAFPGAAWRLPGSFVVCLAWAPFARLRLGLGRLCSGGPPLAWFSKLAGGCSGIVCAPLSFAPPGLRLSAFIFLLVLVARA